MAKIFEQFHFSLIERDQRDAFETQMSREDWLRKKLGATIEFMHSGKVFYWVPQSYSDEFIVGVIEREKTDIVRTPPEEGAPRRRKHVLYGVADGNRPG